MYNALHPAFFTKEPDNPTQDISSNHYRVIPTAQLFFQDLAKRIEIAKEAIDLRFYTVEADSQTEPIFAAAATAAKRGVDVRISVDHLVSDPRRLIATMRKHAVLNRIPAMAIRHTTAGHIDSNGKLASITSRDHKKIVVIDPNTEDGYAMIGGINLAARNLRWNDFMIEMQGPIVSLISQDFNSSWSKTNWTAQVMPDPSETDTYLLTDAVSSTTIVPFARGRIAEAQHRIWLETPYLDMADIGQRLLDLKQDKPDLDVRVIIPRFNNSPADRLRTRRTISTLALAGIATYCYGRTYRRLNHAKLLLIDDMALFGSSNFNTHSLAGRNAEIEIATRNSGLVGQLERWYLEDIEESIAT
jgi:cardiolipin synthase A/B